MNNNIKVLIEGRNINNYIKWLMKQKINLININILKYNELELIINYHDYEILKKYSKIYKVSIIKRYGILSIMDKIKNNIHILISISISIILIFILSRFIFSVEIIYHDKEVVKLIEQELKKYDIKKYKLKKDYSSLEKITKNILDDNKEKLEWLEIIESGTKYIVKLVERKIEKENKEYEFQSIVATKDAIITSIKATSGEKTKEINDYVKKDEIIVSGVLTKPNNEIIYKQANAIVYGEVWYKVEVEYPYAYYEEILTGKNKNVYVINIFNKKIPILTYKKYKQFKIKKNNILLDNNILPINLSKEKQYEVKITEEIYTTDEVISNAKELARKKLIDNNPKIIKIKNIEVVDQTTIRSKIKLNLFISVEEDITKVIEIKPNDDIEKDLQT